MREFRINVDGYLHHVTVEEIDTGAERRRLAAVAAAIAMVLPGRHRVISVRPVSTDWSREGRRSHFESHKVR